MMVTEGDSRPRSLLHVLRGLLLQGQSYSLLVKVTHVVNCYVKIDPILGGPQNSTAAKIEGSQKRDHNL